MWPFALFTSFILINDFINNSGTSGSSGVSGGTGAGTVVAPTNPGQPAGTKL